MKAGALPRFPYVEPLDGGRAPRLVPHRAPAPHLPYARHHPVAHRSAPRLPALAVPLEPRVAGVLLSAEKTRLRRFLRRLLAARPLLLAPARALRPAPAAPPRRLEAARAVRSRRGGAEVALAFQERARSALKTSRGGAGAG